MIDNLKEAIEHAKEVAENWKSQLVNCVSEEGRNRCLECVAEHEKIAEWLTELQERREATRWRPISEPPKEHDYYFVTCEFEGARGTDIALFYPDRDEEEQWSLNYVTAWKPLPKPYESEENEDQPERKAYDGRKVGDEFANNYGIYRVTEIDEYAGYKSVRIMSKEAFTEAYNKYIANDN